MLPPGNQLYTPGLDVLLDQDEDGMCDVPGIDGDLGAGVNQGIEDVLGTSTDISVHVVEEISALYAMVPSPLIPYLVRDNGAPGRNYHAAP